MSEAKKQYYNAIKDRRAGIPSLLDAESSLVEIKPDFYADARMLSEDALSVFETFKTQHPPHGLVTRNGEPFEMIPDRSPWLQLTSALRATGHAVFEQAVPSVIECPYHTVLAGTLGGTRPPLKPFDYDERGLDTLRNVVTPGGELNAILFTSLMRRMPALQRLHGSVTDTESFARNSKSLLREPLSHPQQWAQAFVYSLGALNELLTDRFLHDELARSYTKVEQLAEGKDRLTWAIPTEEFTTRWEILVADRTKGGETDLAGYHVTTYPVGTKLKDIEVTEPNIGCPGDQLARAMWDRVIDVVVAEDLWSCPVGR